MKNASRSIIGALEKIAERLGGVPEFPIAAQTDSREELIVRYCVGTGRFSDDQRFINIRTKMFKLDGEPDGHHEGVDEPIFSNVFETFERPSVPQPPFDEPAGPVEHVKLLSYSKGTWTFKDGSTITAVGPANLHTVQYVDGASQFWVTGAQVITNGTGRFQGAWGLKTVGG